MPVASLRLVGVGPFDEIGFEFDPQANVFVGPNNCGKTTVLVALADVLGAGIAFPDKLLRKAPQFKISFQSSHPEIQGTVQERLPFSKRLFDSMGGNLPMIEARRSMGYRTFVPALRLSTDFRSSGPRSTVLATGPRPTVLATAEPGSAFYEFGRQEDPASSVRDEAIIQRFVQLDYRAYREHKPAVREVITGAVQLASEITEGFPMLFGGVGEDEGGYYPQFDTPDGRIPLNVLSQGTQSLIQWCAQFVIGYAEYYDYPDDLSDKPAILIVDEIDAHLHPSWQRRIVPALTNHYPALQVFCSTHSPLALAGLKAGQIHLMTRDANGKVTVSRNSSDIQGWSADEIYSEFLGVEPTDLATSKKLDRLRALREKPGRLTSEEETELESLREQVQAGLASPAVTQGAQALAKEIVQASRGSSAARRRGPSGKPKNSSNPSSKKAGGKRRRSDD